jgi:hypothetical protein
MSTFHKLYDSILTAKIKDGSKLLYSYLSSLSNMSKNKTVFVTNETLSKNLNKGRGMIKAYLFELQNCGLIVINFNNNKRIITVNDHNSYKEPKSVVSKPTTKNNDQWSVDQPAMVSKLASGGQYTDDQRSAGCPDYIVIIEDNNKINYRKEDELNTLGVSQSSLDEELSVKDNELIEKINWARPKERNQWLQDFIKLNRDNRCKFNDFICKHYQEIDTRKLDIKTVIQNKLFTMKRYNTYYDNKVLQNPFNKPIPLLPKRVERKASYTLYD